MPLSKGLREFVELFNANEVEYLVVGAFALAFDGVARYTADLDLFIRPNPKNAENILSVLAHFGFSGLGVKAADLQQPDLVIQLGVNPNRIDLLTGIAGVSFEEAWQSRIEGPLEEIQVHYIGTQSLLRNKESIGRTRDIADAEELRKRLGAKGN